MCWGKLGGSVSCGLLLEPLSSLGGSQRHVEVGGRSSRGSAANASRPCCPQGWEREDVWALYSCLYSSQKLLPGNQSFTFNV